MWTRKLSTSSSNSRGASVCRTTTPITSPPFARIGTATIDWKLSSSSSGTNFIRGSLHRVLADELGRLGPRDPSGEALVDPEAKGADEPRVPLGGGAQHQAVALEEVDEAGVAAGRVGRDIDDPAQDPVQVERGRDRLDDRVEGLVLALRPPKRVALLDQLQIQTSLLSRGRCARIVLACRAQPYGPILHLGTLKYVAVAHCKRAPSREGLQPSVVRNCDHIRRRSPGWTSCSPR